MSSALLVLDQQLYHNLRGLLAKNLKVGKHCLLFWLKGANKDQLLLSFVLLCKPHLSHCGISDAVGPKYLTQQCLPVKYMFG